MPEAFISRMTSPGPGLGSGNSRSSSSRSPRKTMPRMTASFGLGTPREAGDGEIAEVETGLAVEQAFGRHLAGGGGGVEGVAAETHREEQPLDTGRPVDDGVLVGREGPEPRPRMPHLR